MSINDLMGMDLGPFLIIGGIVVVIVYICVFLSLAGAKVQSKSIEEKTEHNLKVVSKELGEWINIGGTAAVPEKGYRCTLVFQRQDGSRLVLKTSKAEIYEKIIVGDKGDIKYKDIILTDFIHISN